MTTFLFWNINRKEIGPLIVDLTHLHNVDVLILVESEIAPAHTLTLLNQQSAEFFFAPSFCEKIQIFTRFPAQFIHPVVEMSRMTIRRLTLPGLTEILLAAAHLPSKVNWSEDDQAAECWNIAEEIKRAETREGHERTVFVGDFNMNPFEKGVVQTTGFNAVMTKSIAERKQRTVQGRRYPFFYNPMWSFFGDATPGPAGTHYYEHSGHVSYFWNVFDQVLVRPDLLPHFRSEDLQILATIGEMSLLNQSGRPDASRASDHLPILFRMNL